MQQIEAGELESPETMTMLRGWLEPMKAQNIDRIVLGCTHYPFVRNAIRTILGDGVTIIDPAPAIAKQVRRILESRNEIPQGGHGALHWYTSGNAQQFAHTLQQLTGINQRITQLRWNENKLQE